MKNQKHTGLFIQLIPQGFLDTNVQNCNSHLCPFLRLHQILYTKPFFPLYMCKNLCDLSLPARAQTLILLYIAFIQNYFKIFGENIH